MTLEERLTKLIRKKQQNPHWLDWLTVREAARTLRVRQATIIEHAEADENIDILVGLRNHSGSASFQSIGDYRLELIEEDAP